MRNLIILLSMLLAGWSYSQDGAAMMMLMGAAEQQVAFPSDGLVAYYSLDGDAYDKVTTSSGTWGATAVETNLSISGTALRIPDGTSGYVTTLNDALLHGEPNYTISLWAYQISYVWSAGIICSRGTKLTTISRDNNNPVGDCYASSGWSSSVNQISGITYSNSIHNLSWTHMVSIGKNVDGSRITELWSDGSLVQAVTNSGNDTISQDDFFKIGLDDIGTTRYFDGIIDEVGIWNRALTEQEISDIYENQLVYP